MGKIFVQGLGYQATLPFSQMRAQLRFVANEAVNLWFFFSQLMIKPELPPVKLVCLFGSVVKSDIWVEHGLTPGRRGKRVPITRATCP